MLTIDISATSTELINWQAVTNAMLKGEQVSVKKMGVEIGLFLPKTKQMFVNKRKLGFMQGEGVVPDDIHWGDDEIQMMFDETIYKDDGFNQ
ncbi:hypothetical protein ACGTJS_10190 [Faucicola mancuniensis]|uniref:hypothetical protein n=1 Tax=Faucicola mancuniensis TaxID=1309795 RepID=UPI0028E53205|nr:hypothetical protein [uncultured Moraxella sp.]